MSRDDTSLRLSAPRPSVVPSARGGPSDACPWLVFRGPRRHVIAAGDAIACRFLVREGPVGEVPERLNGAVSKTVVGVTPLPRVRIPPSPLAVQNARSAGRSSFPGRPGVRTRGPRRAFVVPGATRRPHPGAAPGVRRSRGDPTSAPGAAPGGPFARRSPPPQPTAGHPESASSSARAPAPRCHPGARRDRRGVPATPGLPRSPVMVSEAPQRGGRHPDHRPGRSRG